MTPAIEEELSSEGEPPTFEWGKPLLGDSTGDEEEEEEVDVFESAAPVYLEQEEVSFVTWDQSTINPLEESNQEHKDEENGPLFRTVVRETNATTLFTTVVKTRPRSSDDKLSPDASPLGEAVEGANNVAGDPSREAINIDGSPLSSGGLPTAAREQESRARDRKHPYDASLEFPEVPSKKIYTGISRADGTQKEYSAAETVGYRFEFSTLEQVEAFAVLDREEVSVEKASHRAIAETSVVNGQLYRGPNENGDPASPVLDSADPVCLEEEHQPEQPTQPNQQASEFIFPSTSHRAVDLPDWFVPVKAESPRDFDDVQFVEVVRPASPEPEVHTAPEIIEEVFPVHADVGRPSRVLLIFSGEEEKSEEPEVDHQKVLDGIHFDFGVHGKVSLDDPRPEESLCSCEDDRQPVLPDLDALESSAEETEGSPGEYLSSDEIVEYVDERGVLVRSIITTTVTSKTVTSQELKYSNGESATFTDPDNRKSSRDEPISTATRNGNYPGLEEPATAPHRGGASHVDVPPEKTQQHSDHVLPSMVERKLDLPDWLEPVSSEPRTPVEFREELFMVEVRPVSPPSEVHDAPEVVEEVLPVLHDHRGPHHELQIFDAKPKGLEGQDAEPENLKALDEIRLDFGVYERKVTDDPHPEESVSCSEVDPARFIPDLRALDQPADLPPTPQDNVLPGEVGEADDGETVDILLESGEPVHLEEEPGGEEPEKLEGETSDVVFPSEAEHRVDLPEWLVPVAAEEKKPTEFREELFVVEIRPVSPLAEVNTAPGVIEEILPVLHDDRGPHHELQIFDAKPKGLEGQDAEPENLKALDEIRFDFGVYEKTASDDPHPEESVSCSEVDPARFIPDLRALDQPADLPPTPQDNILPGEVGEPDDGETVDIVLESGEPVHLEEEPGGEEPMELEEEPCESDDALPDDSKEPGESEDFDVVLDSGEPVHLKEEPDGEEPEKLDGETSDVVFPSEAKHRVDLPEWLVPVAPEEKEPTEFREELFVVEIRPVSPPSEVHAAPEVVEEVLPVLRDHRGPHHELQIFDAKPKGLEGQGAEPENLKALDEIRFDFGVYERKVTDDPHPEESVSCSEVDPARFIPDLRALDQPADLSPTPKDNILPGEVGEPGDGETVDIVLESGEPVHLEEEPDGEKPTELEGEPCESDDALPDEPKEPGDTEGANVLESGEPVHLEEEPEKLEGETSDVVFPSEAEHRVDLPTWLVPVAPEEKKPTEFREELFVVEIRLVSPLAEVNTAPGVIEEILPVLHDDRGPHHELQIFDAKPKGLEGQDAEPENLKALDEIRFDFGVYERKVTDDSHPEESVSCSEVDPARFIPDLRALDQPADLPPTPQDNILPGEVGEPDDGETVDIVLESGEPVHLEEEPGGEEPTELEEEPCESGDAFLEEPKEPGDTEGANVLESGEPVHLEEEPEKLEGETSDVVFPSEAEHRVDLPTWLVPVAPEEKKPTEFREELFVVEIRPVCPLTEVNTAPGVIEEVLPVNLDQPGPHYQLEIFDNRPRDSGEPEGEEALKVLDEIKFDFGVHVRTTSDDPHPEESVSCDEVGETRPLPDLNSLDRPANDSENAEEMPRDHGDVESPSDERPMDSEVEEPLLPEKEKKTVDTEGGGELLIIFFRLRERLPVKTSMGRVTDESPRIGVKVVSTHFVRKLFRIRLSFSERASPSGKDQTKTAHVEEGEPVSEEGDTSGKFITYKTVFLKRSPDKRAVVEDRSSKGERPEGDAPAVEEGEGQGNKPLIEPETVPLQMAAALPDVFSEPEQEPEGKRDVHSTPWPKEVFDSSDAVLESAEPVCLEQEPPNEEAVGVLEEPEKGESVVFEEVLFRKSSVSSASSSRAFIRHELRSEQRYIMIIKKLYQLVVERRSVITIYCAKFRQFNFVFENFLQWILSIERELSSLRPVTWKLADIRRQQHSIQVPRVTG